MDILGLFVCCFYLIGSRPHERTVLLPACKHPVNSTLIEHNIFSANHYYYFPENLPFDYSSTTPVCADLVRGIFSGEPVIFRQYHYTCAGNVITDRSIKPVFVHRQSKTYSCHHSIIYSVDSSTDCWFYCADKVGSSRHTVFLSRCSNITVPIRVIDHSGFGEIVSTISHSVIDVLEYIVEIVLLKLFGVGLDCSSRILASILNGFGYLHPIKTLFVILVIRPYLPAPALIIVAISLTLLVSKLNL